VASNRGFEFERAASNRVERPPLQALDSVQKSSNARLAVDRLIAVAGAMDLGRFTQRVICPPRRADGVRRGEIALDDLADCLDLDLAFTPATNAVQIRRLGLRESLRMSRQ
jgi:hypothetical protein